MTGHLHWHKAARSLRHGTRVILSRPVLTSVMVMRFCEARLRHNATVENSIVIATHHKVLTNYFIRIFRTFAIITNRSFSVGTGEQLDYGSDIVFDHHSRLDFSRLERPFFGLHVKRDPRDLIVSAAYYHLKSEEPWLHVPKREFGGKSYQDHLRSLPNMEDVLMFEMENASYKSIKEMSSWNYDNDNMLELKYESLVERSAAILFKEGITAWPLKQFETDLLVNFFKMWSIYSTVTNKSRHIRDPMPNQWKQNFTPKVERQFLNNFANDLKILGYD